MSPPFDLADIPAAIRGLAPGRSFAVIGGVWRQDEVVSVALKADAASATMIDAVPLSNPAWQSLRERVLGETPRSFSAVQANIGAAGVAEQVGSFDIVYSPAAIFHRHSPIDYLINLRRITREHLILTSMTVPDKISHGGQQIDLGGGRFLSTHGLDPMQAAVVNGHFAALGIVNVLSGTDDLLLPSGLPNAGPWWWLFTAESLRRLLSLAGFETLAADEAWKGRSHAFLCRPRPSAASARAPPAIPGAAEERAARRALTAAHQAFGLDAAWWAGGIAAELRFWDDQIKTGGGRWRESFQLRIGPDPPLDQRLESLVRDMGLNAVDILDVGAGPVTSVGTASEYCRPRVRAVDPLARPYARMLNAANIAPAVETEFAPAETLSYLLPPHSFDIVHCRNALDHAVNPLLGILQMLCMLRPGGVVYLSHHSNAGDRAGYTGMQQFNFYVKGNRLFVANPVLSIDIGQWLHGIATVEAAAGGLAVEAFIRPAEGRFFEPGSSEAEMAELAASIHAVVRAAQPSDRPAP